MASPPPSNIGAITSATLIGTLLNFFLFGVLFVQVYVYNVCFPKDRLAIKRLVSFVFLAMAVCTCLNAADAHYWYAANFGDLAKFAEPRFSPAYTPITGSVIALIVQLFYCYRISVFRTGAVSMIAFIALAAFVQAAGGIGGGIKAYIAQNEEHDQARTILVYMWLAGDAFADIVIAFTMTHLLANAPEKETKHMVRRVVRLVIETNTFTAAIAIVGLVLFAGLPGTDYFICPTMILPGIYANTLLVLLNNRARPHSQTENANTYYVSGETTARGSTRVDVDLGAFIAAPNQPKQLEPFAAAPREHGAVSWDSNSLELGDDDRAVGKWRRVTGSTA